MEEITEVPIKKQNEDALPEGKLFSRAYCHTDGEWLDEWNTDFHLTTMHKQEHINATAHAVTLHFK